MVRPIIVQPIMLQSIVLQSIVLQSIVLQSIMESRNVRRDLCASQRTAGFGDASAWNLLALGPRRFPGFAMDPTALGAALRRLIILGGAAPNRLRSRQAFSAA